MQFHFTTSEKKAQVNDADGLGAPSYELHDVYRALSVLAKESDFIQAEVYKNSFFLENRNDKVLYYDCTNYYFEIEQEDGNKKYGKSLFCICRTGSAVVITACCKLP